MTTRGLHEPKISGFKMLYTYLIDFLCDFPWSHRQHLGGSPFHAMHSEAFGGSQL